MAIHIESNGRSLWVERAGTGSPVVLLEAGLDCPSELWDPIWQGLQAFTTVIRYDRANLGQSDPAPAPRTPDDLVGDLSTHLVPERGGHVLHHDQPDLVVEAIRTLTNSVR